MRIIELTEEARTNILENLLKRSPNSYGEFEGRVNEIIENVRANRDAAIFDYTKRFDVVFLHRAGAAVCVRYADGGRRGKTAEL